MSGWPDHGQGLARTACGFHTSYRPAAGLESSRCDRGHLILVQIKLSHSTGQEISCFRTMLRELTKFMKLSAWLMT